MKKKLLSHLTWLFPWGLIAAFIFFVAAWLRFWQLGALPLGLTWDEAFLGYVGKMVVTTGYDEHGVFLPTVFRSFGDFKAPLAVYLTGISTSLFGLTQWAVRLPYALTSLLTIAALAGIVWFRTKAWGWSLLAAWLLATAPWHILFSRIAFESGIATFGLALVLLGWQMVRPGSASALKENKTKLMHRAGWVSMILGAWIALYAYHSSKIVIPLVVLSLVGWELRHNWRIWQQRWQEWLTAGLIGTLGLIPFVISLLNGGLGRANQTVFWHDLRTNESFWQRFFDNVFAHLNWNFLVSGSTDTLRHSTGVAGVFTITFVLTLIFTTGYMLWIHHQQGPSSGNQTARRARNELWLWGLFALIGLLPAVLGFEVPHPNRALMAVVPACVLLTALVQITWNQLVGNTRQLLVASLILFSALETAAFWQDLTLVYPERSAAAWIEGTQTVSHWAAATAAADLSVAVSATYGEPDIFYAFATDWSIERYRARDFGKVRFVPQDQLVESGADRLASTAVIDDPRYILIDEVRRSDHLPAYWLYARTE